MSQPSQQFVAAVNQVISSGDYDIEAIWGRLRQVYPQIQESEEALLQAAIHPATFSIERVLEADATFAQSYALLATILSEAVVDPPSVFVERLANNLPVTNTHTFILMRRYWSTQGGCRYTTEGKLSHFDADKLSLSQHVASVIAGDYITLKRLNRHDEAMAGIGQLVTRSTMQRGYGHGKALVSAFEQQCHELARAEGRTLKAIVLESEGEAKLFWAKMGYRWIQDSRYYQPPISWDKNGEPTQPEVPETLMIKWLEQPDATEIPKSLIKALVEALYWDWYVPDDLSTEGRQRVENYVFGKLFADFEISLAVYGESVPLALPPPQQTTI